MIKRKSWKPTLTSQFKVCPVPLHMDTYRGCTFDCSYCFARDFVTFSRRNSENKTFTYLEGNRPDLLRNWLVKVFENEYDYSKGEKVAVKERMPIKIGATADPFPSIERKELITYDTLKVLHEFDYPVEIQTKNPAVLAEYSHKFDNPNWVIAVTLITTDEKFLRVCEPSAPSAKSRLEAIKKLTDEGKKVIVKIQPAIYPAIIRDLPDLVKGIAESGAFGFNTEGLKLRVAMPEKEKELFRKIGNYLDMDIINFYKNEQKVGTDRELTVAKKKEYTFLAKSLATKYGLRYFSADNDMGCYGDNSECCGTEVLRDYKLWENNIRTKSFPEGITNDTTELGKCKVNFMRSQTNAERTMDEVMEIEYNKVKKTTNFLDIKKRKKK